jgi:hypothetical protein
MVSALLLTHQNGQVEIVNAVDPDQLRQAAPMPSLRGRRRRNRDSRFMLSYSSSTVTKVPLCRHTRGLK